MTIKQTTKIVFSMVVLLLSQSYSFAQTKENWKTVYKFSGSANETTDDFKINSSKWRIVWEANKQHETIEGGNLAIYLVYPDGDEDFIANTLPYDSGKSVIRKKGVFYFRITCFLVKWNIEVQEYEAK